MYILPKMNVLFLIYLLTVISPSYAIDSQSQLKSTLLHTYQDQRKTFLCEQPFTQKGKVNLKYCQRCPKIESNIQWMPVVSHQQLANQLNCFNNKICINKQNKTFKGLKCCFEHDTNYRKASLDLHNFVPELSYIKQQRRHFSFGTISGKADRTTDCTVHVDTKAKVIHTPKNVRGMVARAYLYMRKEYYLHLSDEEVALYQMWHREYPASSWEKVRNEKIFAIQGNRNPYV